MPPTWVEAFPYTAFLAPAHHEPAIKVHRCNALHPATTSTPALLSPCYMRTLAGMVCAQAVCQLYWHASISPNTTNSSSLVPDGTWKEGRLHFTGGRFPSFAMGTQAQLMSGTNTSAPPVQRPTPRARTSAVSFYTAALCAEEAQLQSHSPNTIDPGTVLLLQTPVLVLCCV